MKLPRNWFLFIMLPLAAVVGLRHFSISYNPIWLFSKYRLYRKWIIAQSKLETANWTSKLYKEQNNAFGMKCIVSRKTTSTGCGATGFAIYRSVGDSLADYLYWLKLREMPTNINSAAGYFLALKDRGYFQERYSDYLAAVLKYLNEKK